ncbi:MAG: PRC-barrel domain-containing protein, partial [Candidatus Thorarchaeota archaeon]
EVVILFKAANIRFSEMKNKDILDSKGQKIGRVIDFHFLYEDAEVKLKSIVMGGSRIEEFLESVGLRADIDPFFPLEVIDRFENDHLHLKVEYKKLTEPVKLGPKEIRLSTLSKRKIIDLDKNNIGNIIDVVFDEKGNLWFVVGGGFFEEFSERIGIRPDIDFLVPQDFVTNISADAINIKYSKMQLSSTAEAEWEREKQKLAKQRVHVGSSHQFLWLNESPARKY